MRAKYSISNDALHGIMKYHQYLIDENGASISGEYIEGIFEKLQLPAEFPDMGKTRLDIEVNLISFPYLKFKRVIFYEKSLSGIFVLRVLGSRQDHEDIPGKYPV